MFVIYNVYMKDIGIKRTIIVFFLRFIKKKNQKREFNHQYNRILSIFVACFPKTR